ncbi:acyl-CoA thioesterase [Rubeoparvulum massiliense]|uniref:acyl-CoA thioesterase n=1 Tax=Rubeoparvulum massiliense TaxID=1631346 RepID=UPI00065DFB83|nr:thioesterase family protein [Rubeoparvulum massiliense]
MDERFRTSLRVRFQETDQMGVVYHANYLSWFEVGRTALLRNWGMSYGDLERGGFLLPVVEAHCYYGAPAHYEDEIIVQTTIAEYSNVRLIFEYEVFCQASGKLLMHGSTQHAWVDATFRPINLRRKHPELYQLLEQIYETGKGHGK